MKDSNPRYLNLKLVIGLFVITLICAYFNNHGDSNHFLRSFSGALVTTTISFYFIQFSHEKQNTILSNEFKVKQRRNVINASLFTAIQVITLTIVDALLNGKEIKWTKSILFGLVLTIFFWLILNFTSKYFLSNRQKNRLRNQ
jgi:hypothetical protein